MNGMCFECLERRIEADFNGKLTFVYGLSDSPLPFGSRAVVQTPNSQQQFTVNYLLCDRNDCFAKYVDEHCLFESDDRTSWGNGESLNIGQDHGEVSVGISDNKTCRLDDRDTNLETCEKCMISSRFSCSRVTTSLAPTAQIGDASNQQFETLASCFSSDSVEDHVLQSLSSFIDGKSVGCIPTNLLSLLGVPCFVENGFPGCIRHPNICPVLGMLKSSNGNSIVLPKAACTLENILHYSPDAIKSDWHVRLLIYQILSALSYMHGLGVAHGSLCPSTIMLSDTSWCWLQIDEKQLLNSKVNQSEDISNLYRGNFCFEGCSSNALYADLKLTVSGNWQSSFYRWWKGELSNFEYLLVLNRLAGRRWADHAFHIVMPWVIDFSTKPDEKREFGWRDLSKSKWRLAKGDEQLDFTFSTSEIPHHVSDECLSELAVCSYKARRLPLSVLRTTVRSVYEPNEYPANMQRLYQWTPDECIPEFYCDPRIFSSVHSGMPDLAIPSWAGTPEEFIMLHRDALESDRVSSQLHDWIDITFGYKMSGQASIFAKNVMLPSSDSTTPRSVGRRQLFNQPHPPRLTFGSVAREKDNGLLSEVNHLDKMEGATFFCENTWHLSPKYSADDYNCLKKDSSGKDYLKDISKNMLSVEPHPVMKFGRASNVDMSYLLEYMALDDENALGFQELQLWRQTYSSNAFSQRAADDIFAVGCILAELEQRKPLFDTNLLSSYMESGVLPSSVKDLPYQTKVVVEACTQKQWKRRPSVKCLLDSPYFPNSVRSSYLFLGPFSLLAKDESRLQYAATFAKRGGLKAMGAFGAEMCAPYCLPLVVASASDAESEWSYILLTEFLKILKSEAVEQYVVPSILKILQSTGYSRLKVSLLQDSFMQEIWTRIGKQSYLATLHPLIISNLFVSPHKSSTPAASVLLVGSSEELGVPITVHQTISPLILSFGKGLCNDGVDVLIRIGGLFGENFISKHILPLLRKVTESCIFTSPVNKPEPLQSWGYLALMDCLTILEGLVPIMTGETIVKELIEDENCLYVKVLMSKDMEIRALQIAAKGLIRVCQQIGGDLTALLVLPKLKELFNEIAFSQEKYSTSVKLSGSVTDSKAKAGEDDCIESRVDLVLLLYPQLASLLGIEKLRQCCATWLLLEQFLLRRHNWKWEYGGDYDQSGLGSLNVRKYSYTKGSSASNSTSTKLPLNGVGRSRPQSQCKRTTKNVMPSKSVSENHRNLVERCEMTSNPGIHEPWYWFPSPADSWKGLDLTGRVGGPKDDLPWKIRASIIQSIRAHHGALRSFAVSQNESTVFTAGVGSGFRGIIRKWELSSIDCVSSYSGHEEVVNDICDLASSGRIASCDGTVHIWNGQNGKVISIFSESSLASRQSMERDEANMLHFNPLVSGILSTAFHGNSYTTMDYLESSNKLVVGTGNGSLRFIDLHQGQKLHLWRSEPSDTAFPPLTSSICSSNSGKAGCGENVAFPSFIAAAYSTGYCKLFDVRSGKIIASWQAHDGYVTNLAAVSDQQLVSSSQDKTLKIWDLRRNKTAEHRLFRGYNDGVSSFSVWGQNVISISRHKICLSSLQTPAEEENQHYVVPQHLYTPDGDSKNSSVLSAITILPFSRLFLVGTEDGYLKICC